MSRLSRIYCDKRLKAGAEITLPESAARHALRVLRLRQGNTLLLFNGDGHDYTATLVSVARQAPRVRLESRGTPEAEPVLDLRLALGVSRGQRVDLALQKATELGVTSLTPILTERTVVRLDDARRHGRQAHWNQVVISACEQSGRRRLPRVEPLRAFDEWLDEWRGTGILLDPLETTSLPELPPPREPLTLLVGPEGGLTPRERERAKLGGFRGVRLGPRILRTETAPLAALAAMQALWGDFR